MAFALSTRVTCFCPFLIASSKAYRTIRSTPGRVNRIGTLATSCGVPTPVRWPSCVYASSVFSRMIVMWISRAPFPLMGERRSSYRTTGRVFIACGWCRKRDEHARRGRPRVCLRKRRNDLPELILAEGAERLRRDVAERGCREREPDDDIVARCLGDEDEVVPAEREVH